MRAPATLNCGPPDRGTRRVALHLHVGPRQSQLVLASVSLGAAVVGKLRARSRFLRAAVSHCDQRIGHRVLEELRVIAVQSGQQVHCYRCIVECHAGFDLCPGVEGWGWFRFLAYRRLQTACLQVSTT